MNKNARESENNIKRFAEDVDASIYDQMPINNFGKEMLYRMGWKDNQPIGKNGKGPLNFFEFTPRNHRTGLGADPVEDMKINNASEFHKERYVYGMKVKITEGKHKGLKGRVVEKGLFLKDISEFLDKQKYIHIELKVNKQIVKVECQYIKIKSKDDTIDKKNIPASDSHESTSNNLKRKTTQLTWAYPGIIVRIISKSSKYYHTKAKIEDIIDMSAFSLITNDGVLHTNFSEDDIETVIPKLNENVIILTGENRGNNAKLLSRDKVNNQVTVQLYDDLSLKQLTQDDISMCE